MNEKNPVLIVLGFCTLCALAVGVGVSAMTTIVYGSLQIASLSGAFLDSALASAQVGAGL